MRELTKEDLRTILYGATFLASGGGGSFSSGESLVNALADNWTVKVDTVDLAVNEARLRNDNDWLGAVVAYIGAPQAIANLTQPTAAVNAVNRLNTIYGKKIRHIVPVEIGGLSTIVAATVARALADLTSTPVSVVDADGAGRAVPTLTMTTFAGAGLSGNPSMFANEGQAAVVIEIDDVSQVESIGRPLLSAPDFNQKAGLAMWPMNNTQMAEALPIRGTLGICLKIGKVLKNIINDPSAYCIKDLFTELKELGFDAYKIAEGKVHLEEADTKGGFDFGKVSFRDDKDKPLAYVYAQNENMIAWSTQHDRPLVIGPDLACYVTLAGQPFSNDDIGKDSTLKVEGKQSLLIGIAANPALTGNQEIMNAFRTSLIGLGYAGSYVPIAQLQNP